LGWEAPSTVALTEDEMHSGRNLLLPLLLIRPGVAREDGNVWGNGFKKLPILCGV